MFDQRSGGTETESEPGTGDVDVAPGKQPQAARADAGAGDAIHPSRAEKVDRALETLGSGEAHPSGAVFHTDAVAAEAAEAIGANARRRAQRHSEHASSSPRRRVVDLLLSRERGDNCDRDARGHRYDRNVYSTEDLMSATLDQAMARAESALAALQSTPYEAAAPLALQFGREIGIIGRELTLHPELAAKVRAFVERTAPMVVMATPLSIWFGRVYDAAESRSSDTEIYGGALGMRSDLEFFRELYRDSDARHRVAGIDTEEIDEELKAWGAEQYIEEIPPGIPDSHVWWHQSLSGK